MENIFGFHCTAGNYSDHLPMPPTTTSLQTTDLPDFSPPLMPPFNWTSDQFAISDVPSSSSSSAAAAAEVRRLEDEDEEVSKKLRAKIASHPLYPQLLDAYIACQKVGAPPEIAKLFDEIGRENGNNLCQRSAYLGADPELDEFMETYCDLLVKYKSDLSKPFDEATAFLNDMETQLSSLCNAPSRIYSADEDTGSSEEEAYTDEKEEKECKRINEDRELKDKLLRRYSGYISSLKQEFSKKKKKEKLPKEARQILLAWWNVHFKWPYPTEADKVALAEWTGLDQKQINNWFINQRKRHWKPSEEMQAAVLDGLYGPFSASD